MLKMGFSNVWVQKILNYLNIVSFSFKCNGGISGFQIPGRGLSQGGPIFPYLLLLYADAFSTLLSKAVRGNLIYGVKICNRPPRFSH